MAKILGIETTGAFCSVALFIDEDIVASKMNDNENSHSSVLHLLISQLLKEQNIKTQELDAIALSAGPGSYTGLRIGSSSAKGLAIATKAKLISIPTHYAMLFNTSVPVDLEQYNRIICLTDARRTDAFASIYDQEKNQIGKTTVMDLSDDSTQLLLNEDSSIIIGSGAEKAKSYLDKKHLYWTKEVLHANNLFLPSSAKFLKNDFQSLYNFEPLYEKEFYTTQKKSV